MPKYTKDDLAENLAGHSDIKGTSVVAASRIIEHIFKDIKKQVADGNEVQLHEFINLKPAVQAAKTGTIPGSKPPKQYSSPEKKTVNVKPTKGFRDRVAQ